MFFQIRAQGARRHRTVRRRTSRRCAAAAAALAAMEAAATGRCLHYHRTGVCHWMKHSKDNQRLTL